MEKRVTLIIPEFFSDLEIKQLETWKYLNLLLARSQKKALNDTVINCAFKLFGQSDSSALPALYLYRQGIVVEDEWVCFADPVNIQPNREHLSIDVADFSDLSNEEAESYIEELNIFFAEDGLRFYALSNAQWLMACSHELNTPVVAAREIVGENILPFMPGAAHNAKLKKTFSDIQLMLHHSRTNMQREQRGKMEVNSLWLRSEGKIPANVNSSNSCVYTNNDAIKALAELASCKHYEKPVRKQGLTANQGDVLCYFDKGNVTNLFEPDLFDSVFESLKTGQLKEFNLVTDNRIFNVSGTMLKQFWKRKFRF